MILHIPILGMYRRIVLVNRDYSDSSFILGFYFLKLATGYMLYIRAYCIVLIVEYKKVVFSQLSWYQSWFSSKPS